MLELKNNDKLYIDLKFYDGEIYTDEMICEKFPIKYKKEEKLKDLHKLIMFLTRTYKSSIKKNNGFFFTQKTFEIAGITCKNHVEMHRWIQGLINCNIIYCVNNFYQFNSKINKSKIYHINDIGVIKSFTDEYFSYVLPSSYLSKYNNIIDVFPNIRIKANKNDKISKVDIDKVTKNTWKDFCSKLLEYNKGLDHFNQKYINLRFNKGHVIGRAYAPYIGTRNDKKSCTETSRTLWKKKYNLKYQYDISSAVPRIAHLFNTGEWKDSNFDFYTEFLKKSGLNISRDDIKHLFFRFMFSSSKIRSYYNYLYSSKNNKNSLFNKSEKSKNDWCKMYDTVENICGKNHSAEIFYYESYIELCVTLELKRLGINCYNVYDEFYYDKPCDIESIIKKQAIYVYNKIFKSNN